MLGWLFLFLQPEAAISTTYPLEECYLGHVLAAATSHGKAVFLGVETSPTMARGSKLYVYDFASNQVTEYTDGRILTQLTSQVLHTEEGFAVATLSGDIWRFTFLDQSGIFREVRHFEELSGREITATTFSSLGGDTAFVSFRKSSPDGSDHEPFLHLGVLSYASLSFAELATVPATSELTRSRVVSDGSHFWLLEPERGGVVELNGKFTKKRPLFPGHDLIPSKRYGGLQRYAFQSYFPVWLADGRGLSLGFIARDSKKKERHCYKLRFGSKPLRTKHLLVGSWKGKELHFDQETAEFSIQ